VTVTALMDLNLVSTVQHRSAFITFGCLRVAEVFCVGLPRNQLDPIIRTPQNDISLPLEEGEIEQEVVSALDQEVRGEQFDRDGLTGTYIPFTRTHTGRNTGIPDEEIRKLLRREIYRDLHGIPLGKRGDIYRYLLKQLDRKMRKKMRSRLSQYNEAVDKLRLIKWSLNVHFIRHMGIKLVGMQSYRFIRIHSGVWVPFSMSWEPETSENTPRIPKNFLTKQC